MRVMEVPPFPRKIEILAVNHFLRSRLSQTTVLWPDQAKGCRRAPRAEGSFGNSERPRLGRTTDTHVNHVLRHLFAEADADVIALHDAPQPRTIAQLRNACS